MQIEKRYSLAVEGLKASADLHRRVSEELSKLGLLIELGQPFKGLIWDCNGQVTLIESFLEEEPKEKMGDGEDPDSVS